MGIIATLIANWRTVAIGLLVLALAGLVAHTEVLKLQKSELTTENKGLTFQLQSSQANVKKLSEDILHQNLAIDAFKQDADLRLAKNQQLLTKAKQDAVSYKKKAEDVMNKKAPDGVPICIATNQLFDEAIKKDAP